MSECPGEAELERLVRQFSRLVRSVAGRVGGSQGREIADDVEQQVFLSLWKQVSREQTIVSPASYIYRCAVRETIPLLKGDRSDPAAVGEELTGSIESAAPTPADQALSRDRARGIDEALHTLALDRRRAVQAYLAGFSVQETMTMYGWSYQRTRNLVARGMADLRQELRQRGIDG